MNWEWLALATIPVYLGTTAAMNRFSPPLAPLRRRVLIALYVAWTLTCVWNFFYD